MRRSGSSCLATARTGRLIRRSGVVVESPRTGPGRVTYGHAMAFSSLSFALATARLAVTRPFEVLDRIEGNRELKHFDPPFVADSMRADVYDAVHELCGVADCASCRDEIASMAAEVGSRLPDGHRHDGGNALSEAVWILIRHVKPVRIVETGVARGISSAFHLGALDMNGSGHLWSIDLPPMRAGWRVEVGSAVPDRLRNRWTYIRSSSRRAIPPLLKDLNEVDMFVHDGLHTSETMTFEFHHVWPYLTDGGVLVADDADANASFVDFSRRVGRDPLLMTEPDKGSVVGLLTKK
jgi:Methyltransferase domain